MIDESLMPEIGSVVRGRVLKFMDQGAQIEIGNNLNGLLPNSLVSRKSKRINIHEILKIGDEIDLEVLDVRRSKTSDYVFITLSHSSIQKNPWETISDVHSIGSIYKTKIIDILQFGAIVLFESGFTGLVHTSEISWTDTKADVQDYFQLNDYINVVITSIDKEKQKIKVSYRETIENPWDTFLAQYPIGSITIATVNSIAEFGVFLKLPNECIGLLHKSNYATTSVEFAIDNTLNVTIIDYQQDKRRISFALAAETNKLGSDSNSGQ